MSSALAYRCGLSVYEAGRSGVDPRLARAEDVRSFSILLDWFGPVSRAATRS